MAFPLCLLALLSAFPAFLSVIVTAPVTSPFSSPLAMSAAAAMSIFAPESLGSDRSAARFAFDFETFDFETFDFETFDFEGPSRVAFPFAVRRFDIASSVCACARKRARRSSSCRLAAAAASAFASLAASASARVSSFFRAAARRRSATARFARYRRASSPHLSRSSVPWSSSRSVNTHRPSEMSSST